MPGAHEPGSARIFTFGQKNIASEPRQRAAFAPSAASRSEDQSPHIAQKIIENMVNGNRGSHVGCAGVLEPPAEIFVFPAT